MTVAALQTAITLGKRILTQERESDGGTILPLASLIAGSVAGAVEGTITVCSNVDGFTTNGGTVPL
jgi:hypothetical protein